jgi:FtsZ-binding cell division protein ZapB
MLDDLEKISEKTTALAAVVSQLRKENADLRRQAAALSSEQKAMQARLNQAAEKLESLLHQLPAN